MPDQSDIETIALVLNTDEGTVTARGGWGYRSTPPPLEGELLASADRGARALLNAEEGSVMRVVKGNRHVYSTPKAPDGTMV